jgi:hypothetical protein
LHSLARSESPQNTAPPFLRPNERTPAGIVVFFFFFVASFPQPETLEEPSRSSPLSTDPSTIYRPLTHSLNPLIPAVLSLILPFSGSPGRDRFGLATPGSPSFPSLFVLGSGPSAEQPRPSDLEGEETGTHSLTTHSLIHSPTYSPTKRPAHATRISAPSFHLLPPPQGQIKRSDRPCFVRPLCRRVPWRLDEPFFSILSPYIPEVGLLVVDLH